MILSFIFAQGPLKVINASFMHTITVSFSSLSPTHSCTERAALSKSHAFDYVSINRSKALIPFA